MENAHSAVNEQLAAMACAERRFYSQNGEDGVLDFLAARTGCTESIIELGASDGAECNSRHLFEQQWEVLGVDCLEDESSWVKSAFITAENVNDLLESFHAPEHPGILSIDLDGNDFWILLALSPQFLPQVLVVEYNASLGASDPLTVAYSPKGRWNGTNYYGASLAAFELLGSHLGFHLVYCESQGVNAFFVRHDLAESSGLQRVNVADAFRAPHFGWTDERGNPRGHPKTRRRFLPVETIEDARRAYASYSRTGPRAALGRARLQIAAFRDKQAGNFVAASTMAEVERYAHSLESELAKVRTAREDAERYSRSLEAELAKARKAREDAERYARSLEAELAKVRKAREDAERYAFSLEAELAKVRKFYEGASNTPPTETELRKTQ